MKNFIMDFISIYDDMGTTKQDMIEGALDIYDVLKSGDKQQVNDYIIKPLLLEYRETEDKNTIKDVEALFSKLIEIL